MKENKKDEKKAPKKPIEPEVQTKDDKNPQPIPPPIK